MRALRSLSGPFQAFGLAAGLVYVVDALLRRVSASCRLLFYELMVQPITNAPLLSPSMAARVDIREIKGGDPAVELMPARAEVKQRRLEQGSVCLGAFKGTAFLGYIWLAFGAYAEDEVRCTFVLAAASESAFDYDVYVFPQHRIGIAFPVIWNGANAYLRRRGVKYTFSRIGRFNVASRRAHARLGSRRIGRALFLKLYRVQVMVATVPPYAHASARADNPVRLLLRPPVLGSAATA
jgi:hypothetical protein